MKTNISEESRLVGEFTGAIPVTGKARVKVTRVDGTVRYHEVTNTPIAAGLNNLAGFPTGQVTSQYVYMVIGTETNVASLGSTSLGEVGRKLSGLTTNSNETIIHVASWGGAADSVTSVMLESAGLINAINSGTGEFMNMLNGLNVVLADSDFLQLQIEVRVGSHNL